MPMLMALNDFMNPVCARSMQNSEMTVMKVGGPPAMLPLAARNDSFGHSISGGMVRSLLPQRWPNVALLRADHMQQQQVHFPISLFVGLLERCINEKDLVAGRDAVYLIVKSGFDSNAFLGSYLIRMFDLLKSLSEANRVFRKLSQPNAYSWSAIILAHAKFGHNEESIELYHQMQKTCVKPDGHVFVAVLKACSNMTALEQGRSIHADIVESGLEAGVVIVGALIHMYNKCGHLEQVQTVFNRAPHQNVVTWSTLISGYAEHGHFQEAFQLFQQMQEEIEPNMVTFGCILKACSNLALLKQGMQIHAQIITKGFESDVFVGNTLIDMYSTCGSLEDAQMVLNTLPKRDVITWSTLLTGLNEHGHCQEVLQLFDQMQHEGTVPNSVTFICILKACASMLALEPGKQIHINVIGDGFELNVSVANSLINMYIKCGSLEDAHAVFGRLPKRDVVSWSAMIAGYTDYGYDHVSLQLFKQMQKDGVEPNQGTFVNILKSCSNMTALHQGEQIHTQLIFTGFEFDAFVGNTLIDMYTKCGNLEAAHMVFSRLQKRDVVAWNMLVAGYVDHRHGGQALKIWQQMKWEGVEPNLITFLNMLKACSNIGALEQGRQIHIHVVENGFELDRSVGNTLIGMYGKCGSLVDAHIIFERLAIRDVVTWNALIGTYSQNGQGKVALQMFHQMQHEGIIPDKVTVVGILRSCSSTAAIERGKQTHTHIVESGFESDVVVGTALICMYGRFGSFLDACIMFNRMQKRNVVTWNAWISVCGLFGRYSLALQNFHNMQQLGLKPDEETFLSLISACSHVNLLNEGCLLLESMRNDHGLAPRVEHYNSVVDLLGQGGYLNEAEDLLETISFSSNIQGWTSLLSSCRTHRNVDKAKHCFDLVLRLDCEKASAFVLMSSMYEYAGMQEAAEQIEELRTRANVWKKPAKAFIEVDDQVHDFIVGDKNHAQSEEIYARLKTLRMQLTEQGYRPRMDLVQGLFSDGENENSLFEHSERLAIAFGLICTPRGSTIRVAKNLRMCADCHTVTQIISKIELREIIVSDAYDIHHFKDGTCCCTNYQCNKGDRKLCL